MNIPGIQQLNPLADEAVRHTVIVFIRAKIDMAVLYNLSVEVLFELIKQDRQRHQGMPFYTYLY
jgi:hypothetical protein